MYLQFILHPIQDIENKGNFRRSGRKINFIKILNGDSTFHYAGPAFAKQKRPNRPIGFESEQSRVKLAKMILPLFGQWKLITANQREVLGLRVNSRRMLTLYCKDKAIPNKRDMLDRLGWLMVIQQDLRTLYLNNPALCYSWDSRCY